MDLSVAIQLPTFLITGMVNYQPSKANGNCGWLLFSKSAGQLALNILISIDFSQKMCYINCEK